VYMRLSTNSASRPAHKRWLKPPGVASSDALPLASKGQKLSLFFLELVRFLK
jgi:hypothetical protein